jgi:PAS domain S-box-containing protein
MLSELPFVAFRIDADGALADFSLSALNIAGHQRLAYGARFEWLFDESSRTRIRSCLESGKGTHAATSEPATITLIDRAGHAYSLDALLMVLPAGHGQPVRLYICEDVGPESLMSALLGNAEVLGGFIETTSEPMWGIEFDEPVNLDRHEDDIVLQVFSNECHWIFCNQALKRLYAIPAELDMRVMPVAAQFPRNPQNEDFVRQLARRDFSADSIITVDQKHDGTTAYVENNARGYIKSGLLYRIWGTVHDVTEPYCRQEQLQQHSELMQRTLSALPVAVIVIDRMRRIRGVNPAAESLFGESSAALLGTEFRKRFDFEDQCLERSWHNGEVHEGRGTLHTSAGTSVACSLKLAPVDDETSELFVIVFLPMTDSEQRSKTDLSEV